MKVRGRRGGVLGVIVACAVVMIAIGFGVILMVQYMSGAREVVQAADSGGLNVAKQALTVPFTSLTAEEKKHFDGLIPDDRVTLSNYNSLFAHALMVAINAQNVDTGDGQAIRHANQVTDALQTGPNSIGGRLTAELSKKTGNSLFTVFDSTAGRNSARLLGKDAKVEHSEEDFAVAFLDQAPGDDGATNVEVPDHMKSEFFKGDLAGVLIEKNGKSYLRGYTQPILKAGLIRPIGVPVQPLEQPHLISAHDFNSHLQRGSAIVHAQVPPNAFKSRADVKQSGATTSSVSYSIVGFLGQMSEVSSAIPEGYFEVVNGPQGSTGSATVEGPFGNENNWLANEALPGTPVSGLLLAKNPDLLEDWAAYLFDKNLPSGDSRKKNLSEPSVDGLFRIRDAASVGEFSERQAVKPVRPHQVENFLHFSRQDGSLIIDHLCSDRNVTGNDSSTIDRDCARWWRDGAFDQAFDHDGIKPKNLPPATDLLAVECVKCRLHKLFPACGDIDSTGCPVTGLRTFTCNDRQLRSHEIGKCQVSDENNPLALCDQVSPGFGETVIAEIAKKLQEVNPAVKANDVRRALMSKSIRLGEKIFITVDDRGTVSFTRKTPPGYVSENPDGREFKVERSYDIGAQTEGSCPFVNPRREGGIHDMMFREGPVTCNLRGQDQARLVLSSGFKNLLGRLEFTNSVSGSASGFCKPD